MNSLQNHPFLFFFIDDLLPDCFGQKKGMTFRSLLTDEPITDKITYNGIKQSFQNLHAEFEAFDEFYEKLKTITKRDDFFRQQIIGRNKKTHTRGNNCFELVFSQDGRMDVSIIQMDGIKCVLILDVRISKHYDKSDNVVHAKNDALANRILSALDERNIYKTKSMTEADATFKNGLITYQNEILQTINTTEAKFEILLNTLDSIVFSNKNIEAKKSLFFDKLFSITQELNEADRENFYDFIEQQLLSENTKKYHKELLQKLCFYNQSTDDIKYDIADSFNKIKIAKTLAKSFLNQAADMFADDTLNPKNITDTYRIFNKIPTSYLYVLQDELNDIDFNDKNTPESSDMTSVSQQKQMAFFLEQLIQLKTHTKNNIYQHFKHLCEECYREKMPQLNSPIIDTTPTIKTLDDILYINTNQLTDKDTIDTLSHGLMHLLIKKNPSMQSLIDAPQNENILNTANTLGYRWFEHSSNSDTLFNAIDKLIFTPNKRVEHMICEQYPFLANYITQARQNKNIPDPKLHSIYTALTKYTAEEEFDEIYQKLHALSSNEQSMLHAYFSSAYAQTPENMDIGGYILGSLELIELENVQKQKKSKKVKKETVLDIKETQKADNKKLRQAFIDSFNAFLADVDNSDKKQSLKQSLGNLNETIINGLKTLPQNDIIGHFIRNYTTPENTNINAFDVAINDVILKGRKVKEQQLFNAIQTFFANPKQAKNEQNLKNICLSLSEKDLDYIYTTCVQNQETYPTQHLFVNLFQQHKQDDFKTFLNLAKQSYESLLIAQREHRINTFETALNAALFSSDTNATDHLLIACQELTKEDVKICLSEKEISIPATILLQKINPIINQSAQNKNDKIKTHIETVKRLTDFQNTFACFAGDFTNKVLKNSLIKKYLLLSSSDLEIFVNLNKNSLFNATFFEKLLKNKRKHSNLKQQQEGASEVIHSTVKKLKFYEAISNFIHQTQKDAHKPFAKEFLSLTQNGYTELSEIIAENKSKPLVTFFLKEMKHTKKEATPQTERQELNDFLEEMDWLVDFYSTMKQAMVAKDEGMKHYQSEPSQDILGGIIVIDAFIKSKIASLSMPEISIVLFSRIFEKNTLIHDEVIKNGFIQSVEKYKSNLLKKSSHATVLAFCDELHDRHYDEIIQENDEKSFIVQFIKDLKKHFKGNSLDNARKKMGNDDYLCNIVSFLHKQSEQIIQHNIHLQTNINLKR